MELECLVVLVIIQVVGNYMILNKNILFTVSILNIYKYQYYIV